MATNAQSTTNPPTEPTPGRSRPVPKALTFAVWIASLALLAMAACTIYLAVLTREFIDTANTRLVALNNNTEAIYAALADENLRGFGSYRFASNGHMSVRSALDIIADEIRESGSSS
ncbi:hypothetical protein BDV12DRAFT_196840 [Aspergillus spectabilis]